MGSVSAPVQGGYSYAFDVQELWKTQFVLSRKVSHGFMSPVSTFDKVVNLAAAESIVALNVPCVVKAVVSHRFTL